MKIRNPWPRIPVRCIHRATGEQEIETMCGGSAEIELPDDTAEAAIEPIRILGRGKSEPLAQPKIWSKEWGLLDLEDFQTKKQMEHEKAELVRLEEERAIREREERERRKKEAAEARERAEQEKARLAQEAAEAKEAAEPVVDAPDDED